MKLKNKIVGGLIMMKNRQLRAERERSRALNEANSILSAYIASLIEERGGARISKEQIRRAIGKYTAQVLSDGADYVISVIREGSEGGEAGERRSAAGVEGADYYGESSVTEKKEQESADVRG